MEGSPEVFAAAEMLQAHRFSADAISRAYYAVMHAAKAALLANDVVAESHAAVRRLFGQVLVKSGELEREWAKILAREHGQRGTADYDVNIPVNTEVANQLVRDARRFGERIARYLASKGLTLEEEQ